jgi:hypothetical protein
VTIETVFETSYGNASHWLNKSMVIVSASKTEAPGWIPARVQDFQ